MGPFYKSRIYGISRFSNNVGGFMPLKKSFAGSFLLLILNLAEDAVEGTTTTVASLPPFNFVREYLKNLLFCSNLK